MTERRHQGLVYVNGAMVDADAASVSVFDHGLLYGDGVFDTLVARNGFVFKLREHVDRLYRSIGAVRLAIEPTPDEMEAAILETVRANGLRDAYIKIVVTRGVGPEPLMSPKGCVPSIVIFARPSLSLASASQQERGLRVKIANIRRVSSDALDPRVKSLNYLNLVLAKVEALDAGYDEALLADSDGFLCEAPGYNIFVVQGRTVATPEFGILEGITRQSVFEMCEEAGFATRIGRIAPYDAYVASEVFLSSTAGGLVPVVEIDGHRIGGGVAGPVFRQLAATYEDWLTTGRHGTKI